MELATSRKQECQKQKKLKLSVMILGVGDRVREDAEIVGRMKLLDDETVEKDRFGKRKTRDIVDYIGEDYNSNGDLKF
jgi:hypothetical protein